MPEELVVIQLESSAAPATVLRALATEPGLICLWGRGWAGGPGSTVITSRPVEVRSDLAALDESTGLGWFGWLGYDRPHRLARHDHLLRHVDGRWRIELAPTLARSTDLAAAERRYRDAVRTPSAPAAWQVGEFNGPGRDGHLRAVEEAIGLIRAGEIYQVNVCTRLAAPFNGDPVSMFAHAVEQLRPAFGAYVRDGDSAVLSLSPELFLRRAGREVTSSPIKGTRPRTELGDRQLRGSAKDVAENVMIVDLVRNDLGRVAEPGSVSARELLEIQPHPGVWHLVSSVGGTLRSGVTDSELISATFPPGSVTGAPKVRAVRAIGELETVPRGVYTGAVGTSSHEGSVFSVAIRTFEIGGGRIELGVGGGITVDSVPVLEWHETRHKAAPLIAAIGGRLDKADERAPTVDQLAGGLLETMLAVDGAVLRLADHLARIDLSCRELYGAPVPTAAAGAVADEARRGGRWVVRLVVGPALAFSVSSAPAPVARSALRLRPVDRQGVWRHKWADRSWITDPDAVFVDGDGTLLETAWGNLFLLRPDGALVTPPLRDDLLPGVTRRALLDVARDEGRPAELRGFDQVDAAGAAAVFTSSSVSGLVPVAEIDGHRLPRDDATVRALSARLGLVRDKNVS